LPERAIGIDDTNPAIKLVQQLDHLSLFLVYLQPGSSLSTIGLDISS
jgi:hypothetical protein